METVGAVLARNVVELREKRRLSVRGLSARMAELGRPLLASGISKIEKGDRRVDVDDLVALALALDVSPVRLLLPAGCKDVQLTPSLRRGWDVAWRWAVGEEPLADVDGGQRPDGPEVRAFIVDSRPFESENYPDEIVRALAAREPAPWTLEAHHDGHSPSWSFSRDSRPARHGDDAEEDDG